MPFLEPIDIGYPTHRPRLPHPSTSVTPPIDIDNLTQNNKIDGNIVATGTSPTTGYTSFDEVAFSQGRGNDISINNVVVTIIPEPATAFIGAFGLLALLGRRR